LQRVDIAIIGAGATGLMVASHLENKNALLIDTNQDIGAKIAISGGGKCNITNQKLSPKYYLGDLNFVKQILSKYNNHTLISWLKSQGLNPILQKESQYFCPKSANEILNIFRKNIHHIPKQLNTKVLSVDKKNNRFVIDTNRGQIEAKKIVVASGGLSFAKLGATDIGYKIAQKFGHKVNRVRPALVGWTLQKEQFFFKELSGISTFVKLSTANKELEGNILFAHKGISGPVILNASLYHTKGYITINFLPNFKLHSIRNSQKQLSTLLPLPKRVTKALLLSKNIPDKPIKKYDTTKWQEINNLFYSYFMAPAGTFGYSKAEVTASGIDTSEIDPKTLQSRLCKGLYFGGEVLDITGELGGYNLQWAFSCGYTIAKGLNSV